MRLVYLRGGRDLMAEHLTGRHGHFMPASLLQSQIDTLEGPDPDEDPLLDKAIELVVSAQTASVSLLQRRLRVGYTRAGRLIDMLERRGIISPYEGSKPRSVLIESADLERLS